MHSLHGLWSRWYSITKAESKIEVININNESKNFLFIFLVIFILKIKSKILSIAE